MNILVTGASGFVGSAFARLALSQGHQICALVRAEGRESSPLVEQDNLHWVCGSLSEPPWREIESFQPDACLHAAWIATPGAYLEAAENVDYLRWSVTFARKARELGLAYFLGLGTCIEYDIPQGTRQRLSERRLPFQPLSLYARCKNELRLALETESNKTATDFGWGRIFYPYGPGEHPDRLCTSVIRRLSQHEQIVLRTPHSAKDYIYIDDLASAILAVMTKRISGPINLCTGVAVKVSEIAHLLESLLGSFGRVREEPDEEDRLDFVVGDPSRLFEETSWRPEVSLPVGLERLAKSLLTGCNANSPLSS